MIEKVRIPKRAWTLIHLTLIVWIAYILSGTISRQIGGYIEKSYETAAPVTTQNDGRPVIKRPVNYFSIVQRNIFNSAQALKSPKGGLDAPGGIPTTPMTGAPKTTLNLELVGTVLDSTGKFRLAIIQVKDSKDQSLYKIRDSISGATIVSVERNRVGLMNGGRLEVLEIDYTKSASLRSGGKGRAGSSANLGLRGVVKSGESDYLVGRRYIDSQLKNMGKLLTQVRAVPNMDKNGVTDGFKLFSIKKGSLFSKIGLKNHDVIQRINGVEINSAEKGLELFQALKHESSFEVDLLRKKQKTTLRFSIK
jgi:general secretion pathway protein C